MDTTGYFPAGCFGKLPGFGDFVRHNASGREALAFDQWVRHGMYFAQQQLRNEWERSFLQAPQYNFLFYPESGGRLLVGVVRQSHDKSRRLFPFVVSVVVDEQRFGLHHAQSVPVVFGDFFARSKELMARAMNGIDLQELIQQTQALNVPVAECRQNESTAYQQYLQETPSETFWRQLLGEHGDSRKYLIMKNLTEILRPFRQRNISQLSLGLRFPLSKHESATANEVCFWVQLCFTMIETNSVVPTMFWGMPQEEKAGFLFVFFRQPSPKNFLHLVRAETDSDTMCLLDVEGSEKLALASEQLSPRQKSLLDSRTVTMKTFLEQLI